MSSKRTPRQEMPRQAPEVRAKNFEEVALGYSAEQAAAEASRCLQCKNPSCEAGCPVNVEIKRFIGLVAEGRLEEAARVLKGRNALPAICGRVCPQETQCEAVCVLGKRGEPVAVGRLERYVADWERAQGKTEAIEAAPPTGHKVAVVGAGPAGLTAAADLAKAGHSVTIFESLHKPGGVLMYGIPEFRLPKEIVRAEVAQVQGLGVEIVCNAVVGKFATVDELFAEGYEAVFLGTGAGLPQFLNIPGENLQGVYSANEFLTRSNLMKAYLFPQYQTPIKRGKHVAVVGAGNVAMDAARSALRLGAEEVTIVYRRSEAEMPARHEEIENAKEEGIQFKLLTNPVRLLGDEKGWVKGLECQRMELGEPDESGRRRPIAVKGSEFVIDADIVIIAIGTSPNPLVPRTTEGLETSRHGTVVTTDPTGRTTKHAVWAGGDVVTGAATVIEAMGAGKKAAAEIDRWLREGEAEKAPAGTAAK